MPRNYLQDAFPARSKENPFEIHPFKPSSYVDEEGKTHRHTRKGRPCKSTNLKFPKLTRWKEYELDLLRFYYRLALTYYVEQLWIAIKADQTNPDLEVFKKLKDHYPYIEYNIYLEGSPLSARMLSQVMKQALGMVKSATEKVLWFEKTLKDRREKGLPTSYNEKNLQHAISKLRMPRVPKFISMEIEGKNIDLEIAENKTGFKDYVLVINTIWSPEFKTRIATKDNRVKIPLKSHRRLNLLNTFSAFRANGFLVHKDSVDVRFFYDKPDWKANDKNRTRIAAGDQGTVHAVAVEDSEGRVFLPSEPKGTLPFHELLKKKTTLKRGSKNYRDIQDAIENEVNRSINEMVITMDFSTLHTFYLEDVRYMGQGQRSGRFLDGFTHGLIAKKIQEMCLIYGVRFRWSKNRHKSQRCSSCGFTHGSNRSSRGTMKCLNCEFEYHADLNACRNHLNRELAPLKRRMPESRTTGFFWNKDGVVVCDERPDKNRKRLEKEGNAKSIESSKLTLQPIF